MPAIAATVPQYPSKFDLKELTTPAERQLHSVEGGLWMALEALRNLPTAECAKSIDVVRTALAGLDLAVEAMNTNKATAVPAHIVSANGKVAYRAAAANTITPHLGGSIADFRAALNGAIAELESIMALV